MTFHVCTGNVIKGAFGDTDVVTTMKCPGQQMAITRRDMYAMFIKSICFPAAMVSS